jgi:hypothetical protein
MQAVQGGRLSDHVRAFSGLPSSRSGCSGSARSTAPIWCAGFGVSMSQASGDIGRYLTLDPAGVSYDKSAKRPHPPRSQTLARHPLPRAGEGNGACLARVGILAAANTMLGVLPPFDAAPVPERDRSIGAARDPRAARDRRAYQRRQRSGASDQMRAGARTVSCCM